MMSGSTIKNLDYVDLDSDAWIKHFAAFSMKIPNLIPFVSSIITRA